ncbi:MAG: hypothetical protein IPK85_02625 [Gemmatimonadetes bacterium]|nr:hypothetical protein [Gemmatimonadota bacterium]
MAFANVAARQTGSTTTNAGTTTISLPSGILAGEGLLVFVSVDGIPNLDDSGDRWVKLYGQGRNGTAANGVTGAVFAKIAEGGDTLTIRHRINDAANSQMASWVSIRIQNHGGIPVAVHANGSSTNSNPPACTPPWGSQDYLMITARMGDANVSASAAPSGYSNLQTVTHADATNGASINTAERSATVSSEDPGTFTSATEQWVAFTVMVPPATITTPQLVAVYEAESLTLATSSITSPTFTPDDGEVIVVKTLTADSTCVPATPTASGVTFDPQAQAGTSGSFGWSMTSTVKVGTSPGAIAVTQAFSGSGFVRSCVIERWKNAKLDATPAVAQATGSGGPSTTITTEANDSVVSWLNTDWQAVTPAAYLYRDADTVETNIFDISTSDIVGYYGYQYAPTAGSQTLGLSAPVGQAWSLSGVEIQYEAPSGVQDLTKFFLSAA